MVAPTDRAIWTFRRGLITVLREQGHEVHVVCCEGPYLERIEQLGVSITVVPISRFIGPAADLRYCYSLSRVYKAITPDLVHHFTIKPNLYGGIAARIARVPRVIALVEGLGFMYQEGAGLRARLSRATLRVIYRVVASVTDRIWFINRDDMRLFLERGIVDSDQAVFIRSIGVDENAFSPEAVGPKAVDALRQEFGLAEQTIVVTLIARMNWLKGIREFVDAAKRLDNRRVDILCLLVGEVQEGSPFSVPRAYLRSAESSIGSLKWVGFREDIKQILALSDMVVLPTYYREGVPRVLLEAMAMKRPIVATDWVGCREIVRDQWNGFLVPPRDPQPLADAIQILADDEGLRRQFGERSRRLVESELGERHIAHRVLKDVYGFGDSQG